MASRDATLDGLGELEDVAVGVLLVSGEALGPHVLANLLFLALVDTTGGGGGAGAPGEDLCDNESVKAVATDTVEGGRDVAVGMEGVILGEVSGGSAGAGGESSEGVGCVLF